MESRSFKLILILSTMLAVIFAVVRFASADTESQRALPIDVDSEYGYIITLPKKITLNSNGEADYSINVSGALAPSQIVHVEPDLSFMMEDVSFGEKESVTGTVEQKETEWDYSDVSSNITKNGKVSAHGLSAGKWIGTVNFSVYVTILPNYIIEFDANGGSGDMTNQTCSRGEATTLQRNMFEKMGYDFSGWNTESDGSGTTYANGDVVTDLASTYEQTVILYAQWTPITYKLILNNGILVTEERGYIFNDLTPVSYDSTFSYSFVDDAAARDDKVLKVTFANSPTTSTCGFYFDSTHVGSLISGQTYNYTIWIKGPAGKKIGMGHEQCGTYVPAVTFTGEWQKITETFTASSTVNQAFVFYSNDGWSTGEVVEIKNFALCAAYPHTLTYGVPFILSDLTTSGLTFVEWNSEMDGSGENYAVGETVFNLTSVKDGLVVLYGQWTQ